MFVVSIYWLTSARDSSEKLLGINRRIRSVEKKLFFSPSHLVISNLKKVESVNYSLVNGIC